MAYLAPSLATLRAEINAANPKRDKTSDGWIGDPSHQARKSDHNPDPVVTGVVRAFDCDVDGMDKHEFRRCVIADKRTNYFIQDGQIYSRSNGFRAQKYEGSNKHTSHGHVSIRHGKTYENDTSPWGYKSGTTAVPPPPAGGSLPLDQIARQVIAGSWGSGDDRKRRLSNAGYNAAAVQAEVNRQLGSGSAPARKSLDQLVDEVIAGHWGNNPSRGQRLTAAGYSASAVRDAVNARLGGNRPVVVRPSVSALADEVIRGQWGTGAERRRRLTAAGHNYEAVRAEVNRKLR